MSSQGPVDERELRKQQIRPRFLDLAEFDDDDVAADGSSDSSSRRAALGSFTDWPPAATVVRKKPPTIASSSKTERKDSVPVPSAPRKVTIEDAVDHQLQEPSPSQPKGNTQTATEQAAADPTPKAVRFAPEVSQSSSEQESRAPPKATLDFAGSIIGGIQERPIGERRKKTTPSGRAKPSASRFVVRKRMDEELQKHEEERTLLRDSGERIEQQEPGTGFPVVSHRDQIAPILPPAPGRSRSHNFSEDITTVEAPQQDVVATQSALAASSATSGTAVSPEDEEWLDEAGNPMSAFRKSRLLRQGLRPPSVRTKHSQNQHEAASESDGPSFQPDPTRDPGGGADIDAITAVLSDVSRENEQKLRNMSAGEVSDELRSLEGLFGKDVLDALRNRKSTPARTSARQSTARTASQPSQSETRADSALLGHVDSEGPLAIKRQYFPAEPEGPNPALEWMMPQPSKKRGPSELRFEFSGKVMPRDVSSDKTYLSGLHHHGDDQDAPGYTFAELIHLTQSAVAAQRQLAVNVLGRISEHHPATGSKDLTMEAAVAVEFLNSDALLLRARTISIARYLLGDRHFTVRSAALRCLISAIRSLPSAISVPLGCEQDLDFTKLFAAARDPFKQADAHAEASEVEIQIQKDWAGVMLGSNLVGLFLDRADSVITSRWEAEIALELLYRIASCSASHATRVFKVDPRRMCDWITHLGLNVAWPPVPSDDQGSKRSQNSMPSLFAVRLLHQGILADRKTAEAIVTSGSIEHLLRFVVTTPWKFEQDWASNDEEEHEVILIAYQIFDEVLQLFNSLASYGFFASVVARTWQLWRECGSWAIQHLVDGSVKKTSTAMTAASASMQAWCEEARDTATQRIFEILGGWTRCAVDPHELMTAHDITWTQVRDWIEVVHDAKRSMDEALARPQAMASKAPILGALCQYVDHWLRCATQKEPQTVQRYLDSCRIVRRFAQDSIHKQLLRVLRLFSSAPSQAIALDEAEQSCLACRRYADLAMTCTEADRISSGQSSGETTKGASRAEGNPQMPQEGLTLVSCQPLWLALKSTESRVDGRHAYERTFSDFVAAAISAGSGSTAALSSELAAITRLDEHHAKTVSQIVLQAVTHFGGSATVDTLRPFLLECIVHRNRVPETPDTSSKRAYTPLSKVSSLFKPDRSGVVTTPAPDEKARKVDENQADDEDEDEDIDPITGGDLWRCPASGLPLRADWPLLALDDLLHSGMTAVLNRPDNLEADWKPSELEMVRGSLELAVAMLQSVLREHAYAASSAEEVSVEAMASLSSLPSAEQVLLGVMKVFMLEKDQPDTFTARNLAGRSQQKQAGALTGRDLFRDDGVSASLSSLLDVADQLVELRSKLGGKVAMSTVTLEDWTARTYGGGMSFYQFFTDLVGLWDSVSFGDANFARAVMTVANAGDGGVFEGEQGVAVDFRRLVWNDYSDSLRSIPPTPVASWVLRWTEKDVDMLEHYCRYIASVAELPAARSSIAWQIASHHLAAALGSLDSTSTPSVEQRRVRGILKTLVAAKGKALLDHLLATASSLGTIVEVEELQRIVSLLVPDARAE